MGSELTNESSPAGLRAPSRGVLAWAFLPILALSVVAVSFWRRGVLVQVENGPMENFQAACLLLGALLFGASGFRERGASRVIRALIALLYLTFLVLEVDLRSYDLHFVNRIFTGRIRDAWLGGLWILGLWWFSKHKDQGYSEFMGWVVTPPGMFLMCAGALWLASAAVDKLHLFEPRMTSLFVEELIEVGAAWLMLLSAVLTLKKRA